MSPTRPRPAPTTRRHGLSARRVLQVLCALVAVAAGAVALRSRSVVHLGHIRLFASHGPWKPGLVAALAAVAGGALATRDERQRLRSLVATRVRGGVLTSCFGAVSRLSPRLAPAVAACVAVAVITVAILKGAFVAGGSDAYGYVSEAHLIASGTMRIEQPFLRDMGWPFAAEALAPLGYRPSVDRAAIVPIYSAGLPMVMALFERIAGRDAVFYVVPLMGGFAVWMTYLMGARLAGRTVGAAAAILLATSPPFLIQLMVPMSDVPVAAWWAAAFALLLSEGRTAAFGAGLAAGAATLTRPNLVVLAAVPATLLLWRAIGERHNDGRDTQRLLLFVAGIVPACITVAIINAHLYGSPLASGYAPFRELFRLENLRPNLSRYPRWLLQTETPVVLVSLLAPFLLPACQRDSRRDPTPRATASMWSCFAAAVFLCYLFYAPYDGWFWLRFVLPAFPPLLVLTSVTVAAMFARAGRGARITATAAIVGLIGWHGVAFAAGQGVFESRPGEHRVVAIGDYIVRRLPERAVFVSMQYSGSIRYYAGRLTVRYDWIPSYRLDGVLEELRALGYHPYLVLEQWEEPEFQARFDGHSRLAALDWPPVAVLTHLATTVRIYDPSDKAAPASAARATETIR